MRKFTALIAIFTFSLLAHANNNVELSQVTAGEENGHFTATLQFNTPVSPEDVKIDLLKDALDITIPNATLLGDKNFIEVNQAGIKSVASSANGNDVLTKLIFAKNFKITKDSYRVVAKGDQLKVMVKRPDEEWSLAALGIEGIIPPSLEPESEKTTAPLTPDTKEENIALSAKATAKPTTSVHPNAKESEIPVLTDVSEKKATVKSPFMRLFMSLGIIIVLALGLVQFSKWWQKRHGKTSDNTKIRVLTQHHLGPKKSLAIIRVAGETILLGVTDHNISMIKTLALLEDAEVPDLVPQSFAGELEKNGVKAEDDENDSVFAQIRDRISTRIKEMRPL